ncbi:hypothetical protein [Campylobacter sp. IFREMER_LSEM_CL1085]|uniref:hypothetical protein n=1 Tax=Campylobacter sp. IFREMER_LSEM_CL1085 TaxID=2911612 RepID=UPI0039945DA0
MTREQFNEIKERLAKYREIRHLTYENQQEAFLGNAFEKASEYFRAKNDLERIDALCDIAVFCFNAFDLKYKDRYEDIYPFSMWHIIDNINEKIIEFKDKLEDFNIVTQGLIYKISSLTYILGFDFYKCMLETIKEIESRTGYYDDELKKFVNKLCAFNKDEAISNVSKDFGFLGNSIICRLTQEDKNFWFITCKEIETNLQIDYKVKKIYKADYESCKL